MLFESIVDQMIVNSFSGMLTAERKHELEKIGVAWDFFYGYQAQYIKQYRGESDEDYQDKDKMTFNYTKTIVDEYVGGVFAKPIAVTIDDEETQKIWSSIADPLSFFKVLPFFTKCQRISEISGTCVVMIRYDEGKKQTYFEDIRGEYCHFIPDPENPKLIGTLVISYLFDTGDPSPHRRFLRRIEIWDNENWEVWLYSKELRQKKVVSKGINPYGFIPGIRLTPEEDDNSFYGITSINDIVKINSEYNNLWTALMRISVMQSFSVLVVTSEGQIKVQIAPTRFMKFENAEESDAKYITPNPKIGDVKGVLEQLKKELQDVSRVPAEVFSSGTAGSSYQSGYALRIKRVPIESIWEKRRMSYGPSIKNLVRMSIAVDSVHRLQEPPDPKIGITIFFAPTIPGYSPTEQSLQDEFDLRYDIITPIDLMIRKYPELTREEATKKLEENRKIKLQMGILDMNALVDENGDKKDLVGRITRNANINSGGIKQ